MRKLILQLHLWIGLTAGAILSVVGVTGSAYVFQPELTRLLYADLYRAKDPEAVPVNPEVVIQAAEEAFRGKVSNVHFPLRELENYILKVEGKKEWLFYDASTGNYLGEMKERRGVLDKVLEVHRGLVVGEIGSVITGICALLMALVLLSSGLYLWWPRKKKQFKDGLRLKPNASFKRRSYDLHNVFGFYFSVPLFLAAITGAYFAFSVEMHAVVDSITGAKELTPNPKALHSVYQPGVQPMTLQQAMELMNSSKYKGYHKRNLTMPKDSVGHVYFSLTNASDIDAGAELRPMVYLDQYTGKPLYAYDPVAAPAGRRLLRNWFVPIHFGEVGGYVTRVLWFILGLLPATLWVTGLLIWRGKRKKKNKKAVTGKGAIA
ncbi:PepSY-associated TM helix domain-containing protein [Pontibacter ruber]|uniref:PepSY-associated TM helix domain-containing protein n=1 Tax=Pontibacter ruber TaxID=1343895 RepID=A0ABW5CTF8_9BACT|nr:PepSY-associated TM helix domain-containing protein [Pontibacter ruber]